MESGQANSDSKKKKSQISIILKKYRYFRQIYIIKFLSQSKYGIYFLVYDLKKQSYRHIKVDQHNFKLPKDHQTQKARTPADLLQYHYSEHAKNHMEFRTPPKNLQCLRLRKFRVSFTAHDGAQPEPSPPASPNQKTESARNQGKPDQNVATDVLKALIELRTMGYMHTQVRPESVAVAAKSQDLREYPDLIERFQFCQILVFFTLQVTLLAMIFHKIMVDDPIYKIFCAKRNVSKELVRFLETNILQNTLLVVLKSDLRPRIMKLCEDIPSGTNFFEKVKLEFLVFLNLETDCDFADFRERYWKNIDCLMMGHYSPDYVFLTLGEQINQVVSTGFDFDITQIQRIFDAEEPSSSDDLLNKRPRSSSTNKKPNNLRRDAEA